MDDLERRIAELLALSAMEGRKTTYPELAKLLDWNHEYGRGLGSHLYEVMQFCNSRGYPILTTIVTEAGKNEPKQSAMPHIRAIIGTTPIRDEQKKVSSFDWSSVPEFLGLAKPKPEIDFSKLYASRVWGFDPENWGMLCFRSKKTRDRRLVQMSGAPIYLINFCSERATDFGNDLMMRDVDLGKVLGIAEVQPIVARPETHVSGSALAEMLARFGKYKWEYGLAISRAWRFLKPRFTKDVLPTSRSAGWIATNDMIKVTEEEERLIESQQLVETPVFGLEEHFRQLALREPMHTTYLFVCGDSTDLSRVQAPPGTKLVKIGVSGDTDRRLRDLNEHDYAKIFGISFKLLTKRRWASQEAALRREAQALQWARENTKQASGEFFFMSEDEIMRAAIQIRSI